jgi:serine/threonine-protein kinase
MKINNYEVKARIGAGGMGAVYLAEHPMIGRQVAVKILHPTFAQATDVVTRFFNEAKAANAIGHPGIVDVIDVGTLPDGAPYLIMELLKGESLAARLERVGRLSVAEALDFGSQAAAALAAAHDAGIVHRDLKPANLFLATDREDPGRSRLKVLDFGIAKLTGSLRGDQVTTGTGAILGTPAYMSPEQCLGRSEGVDHRTDIYALGLILYHALAGAPPFLAEGFGEMVMLHMTMPPPSLRSKNPDVPAAVEALVLRALAKKPEERFQSMEELARALGGHPGRAVSAPLSASGEHSGQAPTVRLEPVLPRTIRLPSEEMPDKRASALSTTLSSSAAQVSPRTTPHKGRGARMGLVAAGVGISGALVVVAVMMLAPSGRRPMPSGAVAPSPDVVEERAPARNPRPAPPSPPPALEPTPEPAEVAPLATVPAAEAPVPVEAAPAPIRRRVVKPRTRASSPAVPSASPTAITSNASAEEGAKQPIAPPVPNSTPALTPDASAPRRMKKW